tara:strand:- start:14734 stop:14940 length:207 start_codon:yes stop_codon:yes gene_type:complete
MAISERTKVIVSGRMNAQSRARIASNLVHIAEHEAAIATLTAENTALQTDINLLVKEVGEPTVLPPSL